MKAPSLLACIAASTTLFALGCATEAPAPAPIPTPKFDPGTVQPKAAPDDYPAGPYGIGKGSILPNLAFIGYANALADVTSMQVIEMGHFYNPHGRDAAYTPAAGAADDRLYPEGSLYGAGQKKPTVMAIDVSSVWCPPCNQEAKCALPVHNRIYGACGGGLFLQLQDGATPGKAATPKNLITWTTKTYKEPFPTAIDPESRLIDQVAPQEAFPLNFIVDTTNMKIIEVIAGVPDASYWKQYEKLLADPTCPSQQPKCATDADCSTIPGTVCTTACQTGAEAFCIVHQCQPKAACYQQ
jgi:hypothetical protein